MHINFQQNWVSRSVKTVHTNLFAQYRKLHKFATTNSNFEENQSFWICIVLYCIVLYCIMRPYTDGPIGPLSYRHSSGVVRNPHSTLAK